MSLIFLDFLLFVSVPLLIMPLIRQNMAVLEAESFHSLVPSVAPWLPQWTYSEHRSP